MTPLIQIQNAVKRFGHKVLLDGACVSLVEGQKVGMIGRNGAGKSTLCRAILGDEDLEKGEVVLHPKLRLGYLRQHDPFEEGETVVGFLMRDSGQPDWKCGEIAGQFEIKGAMLESPVRQLSGGWQTRVKLTALLLQDPNYLLLDEPTNFLDLRTQMLLERFLLDFRGGVMVVSHDRAFLKQTCTHTLELSRGKLQMFPGDVDAYLVVQEERKEHDQRVNQATKAKQKQLQRFIEKNRAQANTASQARSKAKQLDRLQLIEIEDDEASAYVRVPMVEKRKGTVVRCDNMTIGYPTKKIADEVTLDIEHGGRIGVVGDNGQGKTTLLRTLVGSIDPLEGDVKWGHHADVGVYAQHVYTTLPGNETCEEYLRTAADPDVSTQQVLNVAGSFLFRGDDVRKKIKVLSGGERARLCLAGLLLGKHNVLILDEPGNHLDVETVESLVRALETYNGTVIFTSHDRYFMKSVATNVVEVRDGRVVHFPDDYDHYVYRLNQEIDEEGGGVKSGGSSGGGDHQGGGGDKGDRRDRNKQLRTMRKDLKKIEAKIAEMDAEKKGINDKLMKLTDPKEAEKTHEQLLTVSKELEQLEEQWLELNEELMEADGY
ncbi:ABC-F family ATP-binding cassette domain-containing protein [Blastopirellula retiformator]|uniref:Putative ABC transporter ATP-binding protein YheS n=1 Tax=Blastopirellula retiformator TaxID=2527970 RepID=A0A5C5VL21_9BACT|nr:ABC-F family ATP-binding cassette domain-containing protein [Blastopirellula retiformator]TWT38723.1 putative ABC transporter ATP-binding protein YheS [Blastopirellula retiformator]